MRITYIAVPASSLPSGVDALVIEGERDIVCQMRDTATVQELGEALTACIREHAQRSWLHVGPTTAADFDVLRVV